MVAEATAWGWPARTPRARWPTAWWPRSRPPAAGPSPWPTTSPPWPPGERLVSTAVERFGRIDGVVCVAGILRERMLFNMSEDEWDSVVATHLKGHFTVFRAAAAVMRKQEGGGLSWSGFTSGAFAGSVAQANYAAAKGGVVSLVRLGRGRPAPLRDHGQRRRPGGPHPDVGQRADGPGRDGRPRGRGARWSSYLLSDRARHVTGQVYTVVGPKIAVWNQPVEVRAVYAPGRWTPEEIATRLDSTVGQEPLALLRPSSRSTVPAAASGASRTPSGASRI